MAEDGNPKRPPTLGYGQPASVDIRDHEEQPARHFASVGLTLSVAAVSIGAASAGLATMDRNSPVLPCSGGCVFSVLLIASVLFSAGALQAEDWRTRGMCFTALLLDLLAFLGTVAFFKMAA